MVVDIVDSPPLLLHWYNLFSFITSTLENRKMIVFISIYYGMIISGLLLRTLLKPLRCPSSVPLFLARMVGCSRFLANAKAS